MKRIKKVLVLVLVAAIVSLGFAGCKDNGEHPTSEHPTEEGSTSEHPASEHPAAEHPK